MSKAQSATEYLVALGGLFVIVLLVLGSIYDIPNMLSSATNLESQRYWSGAEIGVLYGYTNGSHTIFALKNTQRESLIINSITVDQITFSPINLTTSPLSSGNNGVYRIDYSEVGSVYLGINYTMPSLGLTRYFDANGRDFTIQKIDGTLHIS